ncbi:MAG: DNA adenine methylase, partial [Gammaproteobacteria bacterium]|nr:DNA adenine methylase [Gammaproteobacteria bacterium]
KPRAYAEVYNDLDGDVVNFFRVLRDPDQCAELQRQIALTPYARAEFDLAWEPAADPVESARRLCIRAQMGFGSAGATKGVTGFRIDTKRAYGTAQHLWLEYPDAIRAVGERMSGVLIENRTAIEVMAAHDAPDTLHFVDPPYVLSTRVLQGSGRGYYRHEMTDGDHAELLDALRGLRGMVVITGYDNDLYRSSLQGWGSSSTSARISAGRGAALRTEVLWMNEACANALGSERGDLFELASAR